MMRMRLQSTWEREKHKVVLKLFKATSNKKVHLVNHKIKNNRIKTKEVNNKEVNHPRTKGNKEINNNKVEINNKVVKIIPTKKQIKQVNE